MEIMKKTAIIVPTYNEADNIGPLIDELLALNIPGYVVVVDDNSPDGTWKVVEDKAALDSRIVLIKRKAKLGLGTAYIAGFNRFLSDETIELFITMDADFSHNPKFIPSMIKGSANADIVIGSRYIPGGKTVDFAWYRRMISRSANFFAKSLLKLTPNDCTAGFRCYRRDVLEKIDLTTIFSHGYSFLVEMLYRCTCSNFKVGEVPITYLARAHGLLKISMEEAVNTALTIIKLRFRNIS